LSEAVSVIKCSIDIGVIHSSYLAMALLLFDCCTDVHKHHIVPRVVSCNSLLRCVRQQRVEGYDID